MRSVGRLALLAGLLILLAAGAFIGSALAPGGSSKRPGGVFSVAQRHLENPLAGRIHKVVGTNTPAKRYGEEVAALEDYEENLAGEKVSDLSPLPPRSFDRPVSEYKAYAQIWIAHTIAAARALRHALSGTSRAAAKRAWEQTWADYMHLGADYGLFGTLEEELDGTAGGLSTARSNPRFAGLHRLEWGLWTGRALSSLVRYDTRLIADLGRLRRAVPAVHIAPLDYANRSHEIIEDAQRDLLSGMDVPWSKQGVLGTAASFAATEELFHTLQPLLSGRENTEGEVSNWLARLRGLFASIRRRWHGRYPSSGEMSAYERRRLNGYIAGALSALRQMPPTLETKVYRPPSKIAPAR